MPTSTHPSFGTAARESAEARPSRSYASLRPSGLELAGRCPSCQGSGLRPPIGLWVALDSHGISAVAQLTSPRAWSRSTKRVMLALLASVCGTVGWSTLTTVLRGL